MEAVYESLRYMLEALKNVEVIAVETTSRQECVMQLVRLLRITRWTYKYGFPKQDVEA